jgi:hypothetical protein
VRRFRLPLFLLLVLLARAAVGQSPNGTISGLILDPSGRPIVGAEILVVNDGTGVRYPGTTNGEGIYAVPNLPPGPYRIQVSKIGFKTLIKPDVVLNVQSAVAINFTLPVGAVSETLTVQAGAPLVNTESATVSTVVDRQFAENLPLNGRSFQTLIDLTPGVVVTAPSVYDGGQFSVNGQRASSNYWMVDGVSANFGTSAVSNPGNGSAGSLPSFSVFGGTNSLVSVDALQEFRIQTSTYAPEFGRTPGAQISIVTRSGVNQFHGSAFDYLRNDLLDANDWFANSAGLTKPQERQNDFGGTFSGPILKNQTFFFFSYEGLRLRLPQTALTTVPDTDPSDPFSRQFAIPEVQPYLNSYPLPNGPTILDADGNPTGVAPFNAAYSNRASLDAYSLRIDHKLSDKLSLFGRYNYSPSELLDRGDGTALSTLVPIRSTTQTSTAGATWAGSSTLTNDLRFNYSRTNGSSFAGQDTFGGAVPLTSLPFPDTFSNRNAQFSLSIFGLTAGLLRVGHASGNLQRQINLVDTLSAQTGSHSLKFGVDFRRLSPLYDPTGYSQQVAFFDMPSAQTGSLFFSFLNAQKSSTLLMKNLGAFAQDTWRVLPRLTLTYGLRWDIDFAPSSLNGPDLQAVTGFNLSDLSGLALAPAGTPPYRTTFGNVAPRVGAAFQLSENQNWGTVLRGGFGVFYDLASSQVGSVLQTSYPFGASAFAFGGTFPLSPDAATPPPITPAQLSSGTLYAFDPRLKLPYALQWNAALEQALGSRQTVTVTYLGSAGRRLLQSALLEAPNPLFGSADLIGNTADSSYDALQVQFQRRLSGGLQALASYTWSHSIDDASAGSFASGSNTALPNLDPNVNRGSSDFDVRESFSTGLTYDVPYPGANSFSRAILGGWSLLSLIQARSAPPVNIYYFQLRQIGGADTQVRPDPVAGVPSYLYGSQYPGGKAINASAFIPPPIDPNTGIPTRQGLLGRNSLRAYGAVQWDFGIHRDFSMYKQVKLQFRAEIFNVLNHPNFGSPQPAIGLGSFGLSTAMLAQSLGGGILGAGSFNPLYQIGGPRSIQFALKLTF